MMLSNVRIEIFPASLFFSFQFSASIITWASLFLRVGELESFPAGNQLHW